MYVTFQDGVEKKLNYLLFFKSLILHRISLSFLPLAPAIFTPHRLCSPSTLASLHLSSSSSGTSVGRGRFAPSLVVGGCQGFTGVPDRGIRYT